MSATRSDRFADLPVTPWAQRQDDDRARTREGRWAKAAEDASLGVGHVWFATRCPAYRTLDGADCTCNA